MIAKATTTDKIKNYQEVIATFGLMNSIHTPNSAHSCSHSIPYEFSIDQFIENNKLR